MLEVQLRRSEQQHSQALDQLTLARAKVGATGCACMCLPPQLPLLSICCRTPALQVDQLTTALATANGLRSELEVQVCMQRCTRLFRRGDACGWRLRAHCSIHTLP